MYPQKVMHTLNTVCVHIIHDFKQAPLKHICMVALWDLELNILFWFPGTKLQLLSAFSNLKWVELISCQKNKIRREQ